MPELNVHAIDVADYQPVNLGPLIQAYQAKHVVHHLYTPGEGSGPAFSKAQIRSTRDHGATPGGYVFPYRPTDDVDWYFANTLELCAAVDLELPVGWVDCEPSSLGPGPDERWMDRWCELAFSVQMLPGIYCNSEWFRQHREFEKYGLLGIPLWFANWDHVADVTSGFMPNGYDWLAGKQWEVSYGSLGEIDRDVFREEYTVYNALPQLDPCIELKAELRRLRDARPFKAVTKKQLKDMPLD